MTRQLDSVHEERQRKANLALVVAIEFGLEDAVARSGGELLGFSAKLSGGDCLLVLRARFPGGSQVAFVGGGTLADALRKAVREGNGDRLTWRADKY